MNLMILFRLLAAHLLSDFLLQPSRWVQSKNTKKWRSGYLYLHILVTGGTAYLLLGRWGEFGVPLVIMASHLLIDLAKTYLRRNLFSFLADQVLHLGVLLGCWIFLTGEGSLLLKEVTELLETERTWTLLCGYLFVLFPAGVIISIATRRWCRELQHKQGLAEAGQWIGYTERFLIMSFILLNRYDAIGLLIAAKSIFRFNEISKDKERKEAEYFLIGTLFSISIALATGLLVQQLI